MEQILKISCVFCVLVVVVVAAIVLIQRWKNALSKTRLAHEKEMTVLEWEQKKAWEEFFSQKRNEQLEKEKRELQKKVEELQQQKASLFLVDVDKFTLLYLVLTQQNKEVSDKMLEQEIEKMKKSYDIVKNFLKKQM